MNKETNIREILDHLQVSEGEKFTFKEERLIVEAEKIQADKAGIAIKVLSIFGGLLATVIFLFFLAIAGFYDNYQGILTMGLIFISLAIFLSKALNLLIIDTSTVSVYVIGFALVSYGLDHYKYSANEINVIFILIAFCSMMIAQNFILAFISILMINGCFLSLILVNKNLNMIHLYNSINMLLLAILMLRESNVISSGRILSKLYNPMRIALIFSLIAGLFFVGNRSWYPSSYAKINFTWISSVVTFFALLYLISKLLRMFGRTSSKDHVIAYSISLPLLAALAFLPAIAGCLLIVLMSFLINYKTGLVLGIIALIYFISQFYYDLNFTLLTKSLLLMSSGVLFILCFVFTHLKWKNHEKV